MKRILKSILPAVCAALVMTSMLIAAAAEGFVYQHDPRNNSAAMADIVADPAAVYGFRPSETGSLKAYASADWSDPEIVAKGRAERIAYHESIEGMYDILLKMMVADKSVEEIARAVSAKRNQIRLDSYKDDPEGLAAAKARNLEKYGHEEGPLADELYAQYGSWQTVIAKAFSTNMGMDACLGLYDDYFDVYLALAALDKAPSTGDPGIAAAAVAAALSAAGFASVLRKRRRAA